MTLDEVYAQASRQLRVLEELWKARLEVDVPGLTAGVRARLEASLPLEPLPIADDLAHKDGPFGWGSVRTSVWQAHKVRKVVLSSVSLWPVIEGFAVVVLPDPRLAAPVFACDLMALPSRLSVNADVYGARELGQAPLETLAPLRENFQRLGSSPGPAWTAGLASGVGLHAKVSLRHSPEAYAALTATLGRALEAIGTASDGPGGAATQQGFFGAFHAHGPSQGPLRHLMGAEWAERYSRLVFE
jgi:hypothetical protein